MKGKAMARAKKAPALPDGWEEAAAACVEAAGEAAALLFHLGTGKARSDSMFASSMPAGFEKLALLRREGAWTVWAKERLEKGSASSRLFQLNYVACLLDMGRFPRSFGLAAAACDKLSTALRGIDPWTADAAFGALPADKMEAGRGSQWENWDSVWEVDCEMAFSLGFGKRLRGDWLDAFGGEGVLDPTRAALLEEQALLEATEPAAGKPAKGKSIRKV